MKNHRRPAALALAVCALFAACANNPSSADDELIEEITDGFFEELADETISVTAAENSETEITEENEIIFGDETLSETDAETDTETSLPENTEENIYDLLTESELANKTVKWLSYYDPWNESSNSAEPEAIAAAKLFEEKYGGKIEYYPTTWVSRIDDLATMVLGGQEIDLYPCGDDLVKCVINGTLQSYDGYVDWNSPIWSGIKDINDRYKVGGSHYFMICSARENFVVYYNKKTIRENGFDDPWELYKNGEWTLGKFADMLEAFADTEHDRYGLDGWFNVNALTLQSGTSAVSLENGRLVNNFSDAAFERVMNYQYELHNRGCVMDKAFFDWSAQEYFIGEGRELFYISGIWDMQYQPAYWTKIFGSEEDAAFVPLPRDEKADKYYCDAMLNGYGLCRGAGNPEGAVRLAECAAAAYGDENIKAQSDQRYKTEYGWTNEMLEIRDEIRRLAEENPAMNIISGLPHDISLSITDVIYQPLDYGIDWETAKSSDSALVLDMLIEETNAVIENIGQ